MPMNSTVKKKFCLTVLLLLHSASSLMANGIIKQTPEGTLIPVSVLLAPALIVFASLPLGIYIARRKTLKQSYKAVLLVPSLPKKIAKELSPEINASLLRRLEKFEREKTYLQPDLTLVKMAALLTTNTKYVTLILMKHRGKGSIEYITDLKVNYIVELLTYQAKYRSYTYMALGEEAGFKSLYNFTKSFKSTTGITIRKFIEELQTAN